MCLRLRRENLDPNEAEEADDVPRSLLKIVREGLGKHATIVIEIDSPDFWLGLWCGFAICLIPGAALFLWILAQ